MVKKQVELTLIYLILLPLKLPRTSEPSAQEKKVMVIKEVGSIESSLNLCFKEETSQIIMEQEEDPFMEKSSRMKTSS